MSNTNGHRQGRSRPRRQEDPIEIWRARERYYIGMPLERLLIFLLFMAFCVGLGLLIGGCYSTLADLYGCDREAMAQGYCHLPKDVAKQMEKRP